MAKLQTPKTAGFNAGNSYNVRFIRTKDIVINPEIAKLFAIEKNVLEGLIQNMQAFGFNKEEPVTIWIDEQGNHVLVDGRTRYTAAMEAGIDEIPYIVREFESLEDAIFYTLKRQVVRRQLTNADLVKAIQLTIKGRKIANGTGRNMEILAKTLNVGKSTLYQVKNILENAPPEILEAFQNGKMSAKQSDQETRRLMNPKKEKSDVPDNKIPKHDTRCSNVPIGFKMAVLKSAITLLVESNQITAAEIVTNHFFRKNERQGFIDSLPKAISSALISIPPVEH
jgi:ParB-like chromosome segregation protein Spo0J